MNPDLHYKLCASYFVTSQSYCCGHGVLLQCIHSSVVNNMYTHVHVVSYFVSLLQPTPNVCQLTTCLQLGCVIMMLCWVQLVCCYGIVTGELNTTNSALPAVPGEKGVKTIEIALVVLVGVAIAMLIAEGIIILIV